jgi:hypothetical protein
LQGAFHVAAALQFPVAAVVHAAALAFVAPNASKPNDTSNTKDLIAARTTLPFKSVRISAIVLRHSLFIQRFPLKQKNNIYQYNQQDEKSSPHLGRDHSPSQLNYAVR